MDKIFVLIILTFIVGALADTGGTPEPGTNPVSEPTYPEGKVEPEQNGLPESEGVPEQNVNPENESKPEHEGTPEREVIPEKEGNPESEGSPEQGGNPESEGLPEQGGSPESEGSPEQGGNPEGEGLPEQGGSPESEGSPEQGGFPEPEQGWYPGRGPRPDGLPEPVYPEAEEEPADWYPEPEGLPEHDVASEPYAEIADKEYYERVKTALRTSLITTGVVFLVLSTVSVVILYKRRLHKTTTHVSKRFPELCVSVIPEDSQKLVLYPHDTL